MGVTRAILILCTTETKGFINWSFLNQIKRIYDYGHPPLIGKDIFTTPIKTRRNHCVSALINHDI